MSDTQLPLAQKTAKDFSHDSPRVNAFWTASAVALGLRILLAPSECGAAVTLTYDLRVSAFNGVPIVGGKIAPKSTLGDVVTVQLFAIIANTDGNQTNDGLLQVSGSFVSAANESTGVWSALGTDQSEINPDFRGTGSQSGLLATTDNNGGGFDLGTPGGATDTAIPNPNPYFTARSVSDSTKFGTDANAPSNLEFLVGTKTFTISSPGLALLQLNFVGRSTTSLSKPNKWTSDGVVFTKNGNTQHSLATAHPYFLGALNRPPSA